MRKRVDPRMAAICGIARRELGLTAPDAAHKVGKSVESLNNFETCTYALSDENTRKILRFYIGEFARLGIAAPGDVQDLSVEALTERLGVVLLLRMSAKVSDLISAVQNGGLDQALDFVVAQGLRADVLNSRFAERLRGAIYQKRYREKREREEHDAGNGEM
jgi:hypothetical protein